MEEINVLYLNIRSLRNKMEELVHLLEVDFGGNIDVLVLTETWLYPSEVDFYNIRSYVAIHDCRDSRGGGTAIYLREHLKYTVDYDRDDNMKDSNFSIVHLIEQNLKIISIYRPPLIAVKTFLMGFENILEGQKCPCLVVGDINIDIMKSSPVSTEYKNLITINAFEIQNHISPNEPTRINDKSSTILLIMLLQIKT